MRTFLDRAILIGFVAGFGYILILVMPSLGLGTSGTIIAWGSAIIGTFWAFSRTQNLKNKSN